MAETKLAKPASIWRRLWPALTFMVGLLLLVVFFYDGDKKSIQSPATVPTSSAASDRYALAKKVFEELKKKDNVSQKQWYSLANEFYSIYAEYKSWPNRPAALFRNGLVLERIARNKADYNTIINLYTKLAHEFKASPLADDALLQAAILQKEKLNNTHNALKLLKHIRTALPKGDMYKKAVSLEKELLSSLQGPMSKKRLSSKQVEQKDMASITHVSWNTLNNHSVQIVVTLDKKITWHVSKPKGQQILLTMDDATLAKNVNQGARVKNSVLTKLSISKQKQATALQLEFSNTTSYKTKIEQNPFRIIVIATAKALQKPSIAPIIAPRAKQKAIAQAKPKQLNQNTVQQKSNKPAASKAVAKKNTVKKNTTANPKKVALTQKTNKIKVQTVSTKQVPTAAELLERVDKANTKNMALQLGLSVQTVFIDIGHGGRDPGAMGNGIIERDTVLDIGLRLGKILKGHGLDVIYSRTSDKSVPLSARPLQANAAKADIFVSIHVNANKDTRVHGFETYYLNFAKNAHAAQTAALENATSDRKLGDMQSLLANVMLNVRTNESIGLAEDVLRSTFTQLKKSGYNTKNSGARSAPFHVLIDTHMPAILVEVGYCSNKAEATKLKQSKYKNILAQGIARGILNYKNRFENTQGTHFALTNNDDDAM